MIFTEKMDKDALNLIADIIDPLSEVLGDKKFIAMTKNESQIKLVQYVIRNHADATLKFLAIMNDTPVEEYHANAVEMVNQLIDIINDPEFANFFTSQSKKMESTS